MPRKTKKGKNLLGFELCQDLRNENITYYLSLFTYSEK